MDKCKISLIIGMACTMIGAFIINQGFGFIVTGIWAFIASYVESIKKEEQAEQEAPSPKKEIWHDVKLNTPGTDGEIVLLDSKIKRNVVCEYYKESDSLYFFDTEEPYTWEGGIKGTIYDKWCYLDDLIKNGADLQ